MKVNFLILSCAFLLSGFNLSWAQESPKKKPDTSQGPDTFYTKKKANKAALYSAILPGAGQFYNRKYWKPPILYAGLIAIGYSIDFNNRNYQTFKKAYLYRVDGDSTTIDAYEKIYPDANALLVRKDYYRRTRDLMWIIASGVYLLNIIDAYVDAQLSDFDIGDNLSLSTQPILQFARNKEPVPSLALTFKLK